MSQWEIVIGIETHTFSCTTAFKNFFQRQLNGIRRCAQFAGQSVVDLATAGHIAGAE